MAKYKNGYARIMFDDYALSQGNITAENLKKVVEFLGDTSWRTADQGFDDFAHTIDAIKNRNKHQDGLRHATDGGEVIGLLYVSSELKTKYEGFGVYNANSGDEVIDATSINKDTAKKLQKDDQLQKVSFSEMLSLAEAKIEKDKKKAKKADKEQDSKKKKKKKNKNKM